MGFDPTRGTIGAYAHSRLSVLQPFEVRFLFNAAAQPETLGVRSREATAAQLAAIRGPRLLGTTGVDERAKGLFRLP